MKRREALLAMGALAAAGAVRAAPPTGIPLARDFGDDGRRARAARIPIVVLYSLPGCPYCEEIRRSHLAPMWRESGSSGRLIIRQVDVNGEQALVGFSGETTTHARHARERGVKMAPVVHFLWAAGDPLAPPVVGRVVPDFYAAYLDASLETATAKVRAG